MKKLLSVFLAATLGLALSTVAQPADAVVQVRVHNSGMTSIGTCSVLPAQTANPVVADCPSGNYASLPVGSTSTAATIQAVYVGTGWKERLQRTTDGYYYSWYTGPKWLTIGQGTATTYNVWSKRLNNTPNWLSGTSSHDVPFGNWRGSATEIAGMWVNDPAVYPVGPPISGCGGCGEFASFDGPIDVGITPPTWTSWAAEAAGADDQFFKDTFANLKLYRQGKGTVYVRPWYEYNGNWMTYSVGAADVANFKTAFNRIAAIGRTEFPDMKIMLGTGAGGPTDVSTTLPNTTSYDVVSIDFYNEWPWCTTTACFTDKINNGGGVNSLEDIRVVAANAGKPVMISEWGNHGGVRTPANGGGGEAPQFMTDFNNWIKTNAGTGAGKVIGEIYYDLEPAEFVLTGDESGAPGTTATLQPQTAEQYRNLW